MALQLFVRPWLFFSCLISYTVGRTSWTGDQPVARPLPAHTGQHKHRIKSRHPCLKWALDPRSQHMSGEDCSYLRPRGQRYQPLNTLYITNTLYHIALKDTVLQVSCKYEWLEAQHAVRMPNKGWVFKLKCENIGHTVRMENSGTVCASCAPFLSSEFHRLNISLYFLHCICGGV
jgi:hypothetical protein